MARADVYQLQTDNQGMIWDALLYVPTVAGLGVGGAIFWTSGSQSLAYLLLFLAFFFLYQGLHRISGRMMLLPTAPVSLEISRQQILIQQKNSDKVTLVKDVRYFADYAGKSFGLTGMDLQGRKRQYVFHRGQFRGDEEFKRVGAFLRVFA